MVTISIIGTGLIGTSLGMALRSANEKTSPLGAVTLVGYDHNKRASGDARGRLALDRVASSLEEAVRDAQIIVLATPVGVMHDLLQQIGNLVSAGAVVTDTASTKGEVTRWAREFLPTTADFVGGHPMAGKEQTGSAAADPDLFKEAIYCLTPSVHTRPHAMEAMEALVTAVGAKTYYIDPDEHDAYVAGVSHLPFLLSAALVDVTTGSSSWKEMAPLAASGFRDTSRLASGDPVMHRDICLTNAAALTRWINEMVESLTDVREQLEAGNANKIEELFVRAKQSRDAWLETRPNLRPGEDDFNHVAEIQRPNLFGRFGSRKK